MYRNIQKHFNAELKIQNIVIQKSKNGILFRLVITYNVKNVF